MAEPLVIQFAADTSRAQSAMASLAASIAGNMASAGVALSGLAANSNSTGNAIGALQQNLTRAAGAISSDVKNIASATANAATAEKATLQGIVQSFTAAAASSQTAQAGVKAGITGTTTAIGTLITQLPAIQTLALGFLAFEASKLALQVFTAAAVAASEALDRFAKVGADASRLGVSTTFLQTYTAQARNLKVEADDLVKSLENAKAAFTVKQGEGGKDARNESSFEARLRTQAANGNASNDQVSRFTSANGTEAQLRAALDIITEIQAKGRDVAALDLASKIFPPAIIDRIRSGTLSLDEFRRKIDDIKNPDLVLLKPEEILRAQELNRRLEEAKNTLDNAAKEFNTALARAGFGLKEDAIAWQELMARGAQAAVNILKQARQISEQMSNNEPAIYGRDYFRPEDAPKSGLQKDLGARRGTIPTTGDKDMDDALNRLRVGLGNQTAVAQAMGAATAMGSGIRPDKSNVIRTDKPKAAKSEATESLDGVETLINQIEKARDTAKAELENVGKTNVEREKAVALAKAEAAAREDVQKGKRTNAELDDDERTRILAAAEAWQTYKDRAMDALQVIRQNAEAMRYFGDAASNGLADAILQGKSFSSVLSGIAQQIFRSGLQGLITGQGPLAGILGTAPLASQGSNAVGGIAGLFGGAFGINNAANSPIPGAQGPSLPGAGIGGLLSSIFGGFRANGGPVEAGRPYAIGEIGREMFVPNQNGQIVPMAKGGGGGSAPIINIGGTNIDARYAQPGMEARLNAVLAARDAENRRTIGNQLAAWKENN
jgi:hypothetical protein